MNKEKTSSYLIFISIFTFLTVFTLLIQKSYENLIKPTQNLGTNENITPMNPNLDMTVLDEIEKREDLRVEDIDMGLLQELVPTPDSTDTGTQSVRLQ
ncbi:MAG: hypothetical protein ACOX6N_02145 [Patescibacteria group bacterium]|jgi:hypothetical protein